MIEFTVFGVFGRFALGRFYVPGRGLKAARVEEQLQLELDLKLRDIKVRHIGSLGLARGILLRLGAELSGAKTPEERV